MHFILSVRSDFHMTDRLSIAFHDFVSCVSMSVSVDETLFPRYVNVSTSFREPPYCVEMSGAGLRYIYFVLCALICRPMSAVARSRLCSCVSALTGAFARSTISSAYRYRLLFLRGIFWFFLLLALNRFDFIDRCSKHVV